MPHSTSGAPFTLSHRSNHAEKMPSTSTTDPLQYLLQSLNKMPLLKNLGSNEELEPAPTLSPVPTLVNKLLDVELESGYEAVMRHYEDVVNSLFKSFKLKFQKRYISKREHETRKDIYRHNLR